MIINVKQNVDSISEMRRKISETESSSEEEHDLDDNAWCDDSSDESSDDEGGVQTAFSLDSIEVDDQIFVAFKSDRTPQYFVGRVLEVTEDILHAKKKL